MLANTLYSISIKLDLVGDYMGEQLCISLCNTINKSYYLVSWYQSGGNWRIVDIDYAIYIARHNHILDWFESNPLHKLCNKIAP